MTEKLMEAVKITGGILIVHSSIMILMFIFSFANPVVLLVCSGVIGATSIFTLGNLLSENDILNNYRIKK